VSVVDGHLHVFLRASEQAVCAEWPIGQPDPVERQPIRSDVPSLILAGEYDSLSPPAWSRTAAESLSQASLVEFPGVGHAPTRDVDCVIEIRDAFLADPTRALDLACVAEMPPALFVTEVHLNRGVFRAAQALLIDRDLLHVGVVGASGLVFLTVLVGWPYVIARRVRRRRAGGRGDARSPAWVAWPPGLAYAVSAVNLVLIAGFAWFVWQAIGSVPAILLFGLPPAAAPLFGLALVSVLLAPVVLLAAGASYSQRADWPIRPWQVVAVALASIAFAAYLVWVRLASL
jgi:hypothetical protein